MLWKEAQFDVLKLARAKDKIKKISRGLQSRHGVLNVRLCLEFHWHDNLVANVMLSTLNAIFFFFLPLGFNLR